jgi:hypothetical protein
MVIYSSETIEGIQSEMEEKEYETIISIVEAILEGVKNKKDKVVFGIIEPLDFSLWVNEEDYEESIKNNVDRLINWEEYELLNDVKKLFPEILKDYNK